MSFFNVFYAKKESFGNYFSSTAPSELIRCPKWLHGSSFATNPGYTVLLK